jgi:hypothetical protein
MEEAASGGGQAGSVWPPSTVCASHKCGKCAVCQGCKKCLPRENSLGVLCTETHTGVDNGGKRGGRGEGVRSSAAPNPSTGTARVPQCPCYNEEDEDRAAEFKEPDATDSKLAELMAALGLEGRTRAFIPADLKLQAVTIPTGAPGHIKSTETVVTLGQERFKEALFLARRLMVGACEVLCPGAGAVLLELTIDKYYHRDPQSRLAFAEQNRILAKLALVARDDYTRNLCTGVLLRHLTYAETQTFLTEERAKLKRYDEGIIPAVRSLMFVFAASIK